VQIGKMLLGPIDEGLSFLYKHKKAHDLVAALGRTFDSVSNVSRSSRRYQGKMRATDFCNVPPLRGRTASSSKEISRELFKVFQEMNAISDTGVVNLKPLLTIPINKRELEQTLITTISKSYTAHNTDSFSKRSKEDQEKVVQKHADLLLKNSLNKLKTVGTIKGKVYVAKKCQDAMDRIKDTAGWVAALGAGVIAPFFPAPLIGLGLVAGGVKAGSAGIKVVGGIAHTDSVRKSHRAMFEDVPFDTLTEFGKEFYAQSVADVMAIEAQVVTDFSEMVGGSSSGEIVSEISKQVSLVIDGVSVASDIIGTAADLKQSKTGDTYSVEERINKRQLTADRWCKVSTLLRQEGGLGKAIQVPGLILHPMNDDLKPNGDDFLSKDDLRIFHEGGADLHDQIEERGE